MGIINTILSGAKNTIGANPLGLALGAGQMIAGAVQKKKAQAMLPAPVAPREQKLLNDLYRMQQARKTGSAYKTQITAAQQADKQYTRNAFQYGGPVAASSGIISKTMQDIASQTAQDIAQGYAQMSPIVKDITNAESDRTYLQRNEMMADAAENRKAGFQNLAAAIMPASADYKDNSGAIDFTKALYSENESLKKKLKEIEEQKKKESENITEEEE